MFGLQQRVDTLDIVTQLVSMLSILLAQYAQTSKIMYGDEREYGKAVATVMFVVSNTVLLVVHAVLVVVPLWQQICATYTSVRSQLEATGACLTACLCGLLGTLLNANTPVSGIPTIYHFQSAD